MKIAIFYHCLFMTGDPPEISASALDIVHGQMRAFQSSGLADAASKIIVGINGGEESRVFAVSLLPEKSEVTLHGLQCRNECRTIRLLEQWLPGHADWLVLYAHAKGCTHPSGDPLRTNWRDCMMKHLVTHWRICVQDLQSGFDAVGCHWMTPPATPPGQYIFAGNFFWAKASFLLTLPSIMERERIKQSGIDSAESRYESEVWIGNGPRIPSIKDYHGPNWNPGKIGTCAQ